MSATARPWRSVTQRKVRGWIGGNEWCTHMVGAKAPVFVAAHSSSGLGRCPLKAETTGSNPVWVTSHS